MPGPLTWQYLVVSDEERKFPPLVLLTAYHLNGDFDNCFVTIAQPQHLEAVLKTQDPNGKFGPVDKHLSAVPIQITPKAALEMIVQYPSNIDPEGYKTLGIDFPVEEKRKDET